ncbi:Protein-glutamate methylesterase/protein-glutamine glutaminase (plasmid) [Caballeronia sp. SBC1]|uniref:chemotaxis protein CheB n=1 Tax=unclassified Caballeronia TaxID=2646786 RepID=UPI0013E18060|nr:MULTISPECIES: chemotaxis protein CheB [unclassified Caballeronia]QIE28217.1 Protein-glutamate methylesterase/protein-glutamine glutaminase [Caballeronia sp. SBC2]QIN66275.1 Protein-glutamate methylesterase/protein-glutamine glutaminase [Caballeronia sp. SBC1]
MTTRATADEATAQSFTVVGIGASAGGLEAISELLGEIAPSCGMAFLIVQHLSPFRPSLLPEILSKHTSMPVIEAADGMAIEVDHVYVIPPNKSMSIAHHRITLQPRGETLGPPMPIDDLFDSLASDLGTNAIGVILSGNGSDGALGLQAIQGGGGITFAQDTASARHSSMPLAAMGLGCVDSVLAPRDIAREIARVGRYSRHALDELESMGLETDPGDQGLRPLFRLLRNACNIDFTYYKRGTVQRRLSRRMALREMTSVADYVALLGSDAAETLALGRDLLIRVTEFFRDPATFDELLRTVFPRLISDHDAPPSIRIWVPGCASGEEAYSIAICLVEYLGERLAGTKIQVFGSDVSVDALETARAGRYIENIARNVSPERLERFFVRDGDHYCVKKSVRSLCTFARHNVATDPPFSRIDLISCRNLLIYLDPMLQRTVMPLFHYALAPDGVLMLGPSESVGASSELFSVIPSVSSKLYSKNPSPGRPRMGLPASTVMPQSFVSARPLDGRREVPTRAELLRNEVNRMTLERYTPPSVLCDEELNILEFRGDTSAYLANPNGPPSSSLKRLARPEIFLAIDEAVRRARREATVIRKASLRLNTSGSVASVTLEVHPVQIAGVPGRWYLIFFEAPAEGVTPSSRPGREPLTNFVAQALRQVKQQVKQQVTRQPERGAPSGKDLEIARLDAELEGSHRHLLAILEEHERAREDLRASEEELLSSNEEFQSTNEELETAKEELQSVNEELTTTNDELRYRNHELKTANDEVARARDFSQAIVETMSEPLLVLEADLKITLANRAFYQTFQTSPDKTIGTKLYDLGNEQWNIPALRELLEELVPQRTSVRDYQITHEFPGIGLRTMQLSAMRIAWPAQALILLTIADVTQQHQAFGRLQSADQQKDEFLAMLAHELRNPLAAIRNGLQVWERDSADKETQKIARLGAQRQLDHEIRLVEDLLDVSRITRGIIILKTESIDLVETVRRAIEAMRPEFEAYAHEITLAFPTGVLPVNGDAMRIEQVVTNLLGNAIKYTPHGGHIRISIERYLDDAVLTVVDSGIGMTAELIPTIFDIFVQAERSLDRKAAGLGLGLALVHRLVGLHGGDVRAYSEGPNRGSKFVVRLPAMPRGTVAEEPVHVALHSIPSLGAMRILVVDDNLDALESSAALLSIDGHEVQTARDGPSALLCVEQFKPEVVLLDIGLPEMDGYEVARRIRSMPGQHDTLLIAHSGYGEEEHLQRATQAGFDHHLIKPADLSQLSALVALCRERRVR